MSKLDRSRTFAEQYPSGLYEQDGKCFDRSGNEIEQPPEPVMVAEEATAYLPPPPPPERLRVDLRLKENAHLRPYWKDRQAREKSSGVAR